MRRAIRVDRLITDRYSALLSGSHPEESSDAGLLSTGMGALEGLHYSRDMDSELEFIHVCPPYSYSSLSPLSPAVRCIRNQRRCIQLM